MSNELLDLNGSKSNLNLNGNNSDIKSMPIVPDEIPFIKKAVIAIIKRTRKGYIFLLLEWLSIEEDQSEEDQ
jgi:hypothetical protein